MSKPHYYVTTPIYYVNSSPHIGSACTTIAADMLARRHRMQGESVHFLTGTDENALKVARAAAEKGVTVQALVDALSDEFRQTWRAMHIDCDDFIRTTEPRHREAVQAFFRAMQANGDVYKGVYEGWYCVSDETFFTAADVGEDHLCPNAECRKPLTWVREEDWFFRLSKYAEPLMAQIEADPDWLQPEHRKNEVIAFIKQGLRDQSITRANPGWGIPVPGEEDKVIYVWFDALINYVAAIGWPNDIDRFGAWWPADHLMAKEIFVRFHATLWPAMLMSLGLPLPRRVFGHGWWMVGGQKGSKSKGDLPHPVRLAEQIAGWAGCSTDIAVDALRYLMTREMQFGSDSEYVLERFLERYNSDLANDLGNVLNRSVNMAIRFCQGQVPAAGPVNAELQALASDISAQCQVEYDRFRLNAVLDQIWRMVSRLNKYIDEQAPWALNKAGDSAGAGAVLYNALEGVRLCALWLAPVMPVAARSIWAQLGIAEDPVQASLMTDEHWGRLPSGQPLPSPEPLFPRIDLAAVHVAETTEETMNETPAPPAPVETAPQEETPVVPEITIDDFLKVKLRVGTVLDAGPVPNATKLLQLRVDLGDEQRTVLAGIAESYEPADLVGRQVVLVANLKPRKMRGIESQGMILAADLDGKAVFLTPERAVAPGTGVR